MVKMANISSNLAEEWEWNVLQKVYRNTDENYYKEEEEEEKDARWLLETLKKSSVKQKINKKLKA